MRKCLNCSYENYNEVNYCQKCGKCVKRKKFSLRHVFSGGIARFSNSGYTMAPLVGLQIDNSDKSDIKKANIPIMLGYLD